MKLQFKPGKVEVTLSERNLLTMLDKLQWEDSSREIQSNDVRNPDGEYLNGILFCLHAETDEEHYGRRLDPPGAMHPDTEAALAALKRQHEPN